MQMFDKVATEEPTVDSIIETVVSVSPVSPVSPTDPNTKIKVQVVKRSKQATAEYYQKRKKQTILCDVCGVSYTFSNGSHHKNTSKHQRNLMIKQLKDKLQAHEPPQKT